MRSLDEGAYLAELDQELRRIGREDEDVRMGLNEDTGLFFVGFAEFFAGCDGCGDLLFKIEGGGDAGAVGTVTAEAGEGLAIGPEVAGLALALDGHGEQKGERIFAGSCSAREDHGVREAASRDCGPEGFDRMGVSEELVEIGGRGGRCHRVILLLSTAPIEGEKPELSDDNARIWEKAYILNWLKHGVFSDSWKRL
jgi:hypothetical protein